MQQNIPLAIVLQTIGSFAFAMSAFLQHNAVGQEVQGNTDKARMSLTELWNSIKNPRWLGGLMLMGVSLALQITSLVFAPVSVVQPVGLLAFPWSMLIQAKADKRRIPSSVTSAVAVTVGATVAFTLIVAFNTAEPSELIVWKVFVGAVVVYAMATLFGFLGARGPRQWRSLFWASGGAMFYGLEAALVKSLIEFTQFHEWRTDPAFWIIIVFLVAGSATAGWMVQQGYATGAAELVVASMTITSPVIAVAYGIAILGEGANFSPLTTWSMVFLGAMAVGGVITLTHLHHPDETPATPPAIPAAPSDAPAGDPSDVTVDAPATDAASVPDSGVDEPDRADESDGSE